MNSNKVLIKNDDIEKNLRYQHQQKRYLPRILSWTSSFSSSARHPRSQQQEVIIPSQSGIKPHQHHERKLLNHRGFTNPKNVLWGPINRRNTVNPENVKNKEVLQQQIQEREKEHSSSYKNSSIMDSSYYCLNDRTNTRSIPLSSTAVIHRSNSNCPFVIKDWVRHSFDVGNEINKDSGYDNNNNDEGDSIFIHQNLQEYYNNNHDHSEFSSVPSTKGNTSISTSNNQCSSLSSSGRSSFISSHNTTSTAVTNMTYFDITTTTSNKSACTTVATAKCLGFIPMLLKTNKQQLLATKFTSKISSSLYNDDVIILQAICCIWISALLLLEAAIYIALISWYQQQRKQQTTHDKHRVVTSPPLSSSLFPLHYPSEQHAGNKQPKGCRSSAYTYNRGNGNTSTTETSTCSSWHKKQVVYRNLRTALVSLISSSDVTPTIPTCWPPLTESKIITDAIQAMRPHMKQLWAEHNSSMRVYKQQIPVRPTERRDWMRRRRKRINNHFYNNKHSKDDKEDHSSSRNTQIVMNLAIETLEYFEKWYGNNSNSPTDDSNIDDQRQQQRTRKDISKQIKTIHWLRQITSAAATIA